MSIFYLDTSAVVKCYALETGTSWMRSLVDPTQGHGLYMARITGVETVSALTRRAKRHGLSSANAQQAIQKFRADFTQRFSVVEIAKPILNHSMDIAQIHGLRGYDAVHLATALEVQAQALLLGAPSIVLISADTEMNAAAVKEGLSIDNPDLHP